MGILQPVFRPLFSPIMRRTFSDGASGGASAPSLTAQVQALFTKYSAAGGMWDFTDMGTLFQDSARTVPVTAASQPVGGVNDISGLHRVLAQPTNAARPQFNGAGITPDGVDDFIVTASNLDLSACDKVVVGMGYTKVDDVARIQMELSANLNDNAGTFYLVGGNSPEWQTFASRDSGPVSGSRVSFTTARPNEYGAHIGRRRLNTTPVADNSAVWWNGSLGTQYQDTAVGTGNFGSYPLYLFSRAGTSLLSNTPTRRALVLAPIVAAPQVSDDDIELIRLWLMEGA